MADLGHCDHTLEDLDTAPCRSPLPANQQQAVQQTWVKDPDKDGRTASKIVPGQVSGAVGQMIVESGLRNDAGGPIQNPFGNGTGVIISWNEYEALLTCAHNIVSWCTISKKMVPIKSGTFYKARFGSSWHCKLQLTGRPIWHERYEPSNETGGFDIALVNFERNEKYVRTKKRVDCKIMDILMVALQEPTLTVVGYPGDTPLNPGSQLMMANKIELITIRDGGVTIKYKIDTSGGQSGSPVFADVGGKLCLVGVHNGNLPHHGMNYATGISTAIIQWIDVTIEQLKAQAGHVHIPRPVAAICDDVATSCDDVATPCANVDDTVAAPPPGGADSGEVTTGLDHMKLTSPEPMDTGNVLSKPTATPLTTPGENGAAGHAISYAPQLVRGAGNAKSEAILVREAQPCLPPALAPLAWGQQAWQGITMSDAHRNSLQYNARYLTNNLHVDDNLMDLLQSNRCFTDTMREEVEVENRTSARVRALTKILMRRGPRAMAQFVDALMHTQQEHVAETLAPDLYHEWLQRERAAREAAQVAAYPDWELP